MELLLKHGAEVNYAGRMDITPLQNACFAGSEACARLLLQHGAEVDAKETQQ